VAYHDELLEQALHLANRERKNPKQGSLRRAISTAYYALFHLLISEAVANWKHTSDRAALGRIFDHGTMKAASNRIQKLPFAGEDASVVNSLKDVAKCFVLLKEMRDTADYDNAIFWGRTEAITYVKLAEQAFATWKTIRNEKVAQTYLLMLMVKKRD
jgi:uncharacterized protein (UPF0332 family)